MNIIQSASHYVSALINPAAQAIGLSQRQKTIAIALVIIGSIGALLHVASSYLFHAKAKPADEVLLLPFQGQGVDLTDSTINPASARNPEVKTVNEPSLDLIESTIYPFTVMYPPRAKAPELKTVKKPGGVIVEGLFQDEEMIRGKVTYTEGRKSPSHSSWLSDSERQHLPKDIEYPKGTVLEGCFREGELHGKGRVIYPKTIHESEYSSFWNCGGKILEGDFEHGFLNGKGKEISFLCDFRQKGCGSKPVQHLMEGEFKFGRFIKGEMKVEGSRIEEGEFTSGLMLSGKGKITWDDGRKEEGIFSGFLSEGRKDWADGTTEEGRFWMGTGGRVNYSSHFEGIIRYPDGRIEEGAFWQNEHPKDLDQQVSFHNRQSLNGEGKITHLDGRIEEGFFVNGKLQPSKQ